MRADLALLTLAALAARTVGALLVDAPPHVDAAYYTMVGEQVATGNGFSAPAIWSFLEVGGRLPAHPSLPVPSNGHWMPMPEIVAAAAMAAFGPDWRAGQLPMVLLSTLLVPLTYLIGLRFWASRRVALIAGILGIVAGSLLLMYPLVESFAVFGVLGALALLASVLATESVRPGPWLVLAGALAGLASLTRIDGVLLTIAPATAWWVGRAHWRSVPWALAWGAASAAAFLAIVTPWLLRDVAVFGTAFPSAGDRLLWIRGYNEQFSISLDLTAGRYFAWGIGPIASSKLLALVDVAGRTLTVMGGIFGISLIYGLWAFRRDTRLAPVIAYISLMFATMILVFTEHAGKGAFLHSAPAWLPFALPMSAAALGLLATRLGRFWPFLRRPATHRFLEVAGMVGAVVLAVAGAAALLDQWQVRHERLDEAAKFLNRSAQPDDVLMGVDTPSLYLATGLRGVAAPFDPYPVIGDVVGAYGVDWVVLTLDPVTSSDPLGLWDGASAVDADGRSPLFLPAEPAFEAPGVRVYEVRESGE
jgi:hypothetical protein